ncbi:hypothetical protein F5Y12DRAFT_719235 [Xylaria sp. FL1777]|nr:hypothetical protein F5Y12DRAFT_719235 [Xylaria sp. FL1777]
MAILEIAQIKLKNDPALIKEVEEDVMPGFNVTLQKFGARNMLRGYIVTENGRDVREERRLVLVLEWLAVEDFKNLVASASFLEVVGKLKERYTDGPGGPKLFEVDGGLSSLFGSDTVLEYLVIKPKDASEAGLKSVLQKIQSRLPQPGTAQVAVGSSVNSETQEIALVSLYPSDARELEAFTDNSMHTQELNASTIRQQVLADIADAADVTSLVMHVKKQFPLAE